MMLRRAALTVIFILACSTVTHAADSPTLNDLRAFPSVVLVPPDGLRPFADVGLTLAQFDPPNSPRTVSDEATYTAGWDDGTMFDKRSSITGTVGRRTFDEALGYEARCLALPDYCPIPPLGDAPGEPIGETFLSHRVRMVPAVISRLACCNGGGWSAVWYDPAADVTYSLHLPLGSAYPYMQPSPERGYLSSPDNILGAREVAGIAEQLVILR
jgi:hypothetical protein